MELWKHYDSTHTRRHTPVHLHTRTRSLRTGPYSCIIQKGALSATLFVKKKNLQRGLHSRPYLLFTGLPRDRGRPGRGAGRRQDVCRERSTRCPARPGQELIWAASSSQLQRSHPCLSLCSRSRAPGGGREEARFPVRTPSALPARHGPCSKGGKTLQSPRRAPRARPHRAAASAWGGSGRDPHPSWSCCSACGCW